MKKRYVIGMFIVFVFSCAVNATAQGAWPAGAPTPEQVRELFAQIQSGRITKEQFMIFLRIDTASVDNFTAARRILGDDFISPEEVTKATGLNYAIDQIDALVRTVPSPEVLSLLRDNHYVLLPGPPPPMGLGAIRTLAPNLFFSQAGSYAGQYMLEDVASIGWLAIRKESVPDSFGKSVEAQRQLLSHTERIPNAGELAWCMVVFQKARGVRLFDSGYVRTKSLNAKGNHVHLGGFNERGIHVFDWSAQGGLPGLGLASAYVLPSSVETSCFSCK